MFGAIVPQKSRLGRENKRCYHQYYCGLCAAIGKTFGKRARLLLNYDLTNDYLLAASAVSDRCEVQEMRCPYSWKGKVVRYVDCPPISEYFAKVNYLMVYYKLVDNQLDEHSRLAGRILTRMEPKMQIVNESLATEKKMLTEYLDELHAVEQNNALLPVMSVAQQFGSLLQYMIAPPLLPDLDRDIFSRMNYWMGVWIYTADAMEDCFSDYRKHRYNPILAGTNAHPIDVAQDRREELLDIYTQCKSNLQDLACLYATTGQKELLQRLFDLELPFISRKLLGVKKNDTIA